MSPVCGATTRAGHPCQRPAGWGTDHVGFKRCKLHGGTAPSGRAAGAAAMARAHVAAMGGPIHLEVHEAFELAIAMTAGEVQFYDRQIALLRDDQVAGQATVTTTRLAAGDDRASSDDGDDQAGDDDQAEREPRGTVTEVRQLAPALNVWVMARAAALERLVRFAKAAADADVDERRVRILEAQGQALAGVVNAVMRDLVAAGLAPDLKRLAGESFRRHAALLEAVPGTAIEISA